MTQQPELSLGFVGDICLGRSVMEVVNRSHPDHLFQHVQPHYQLSDLVIGNLECCIVQDPRAINTVERPLWTTPETAAVLSNSGIKVMNLANNHIMDCGPQGVDSTLRHLDALGIRYFGGGKTLEEAEAPLYVTLHGLTIALLGACDESPAFAMANRPGVAPYSKRRLLARVDLARQHSDLVVVVLHADEEFVSYPGPHRRKLSNRLVAAGAPLVVQHHPHVIQGIESDCSKLIAYSVGNHIFGFPDDGYQGRHVGTRESLFLRVDVSFDSKQPEFAYRAVPMMLDGTHFPVGCDAETEAKRNAEMEVMSANLKDPRFLRRYWSKTCQKLMWKHIKQSYYQLRRQGVLATCRLQVRTFSNRKSWRWVVGFFSVGYR